MIVSFGVRVPCGVVRKCHLANYAALFVNLNINKAQLWSKRDLLDRRKNSRSTLGRFDNFESPLKLIRYLLSLPGGHESVADGFVSSPRVRGRLLPI